MVKDFESVSKLECTKQLLSNNQTLIFQIVSFLKEVKAPSLEMRPFLEEYIPASIPEEARPTPSPPIVEGAEEVSSDNESLAARVAAETAGSKVLHNYLLTRNKPPLQDPKGAKFF